jgi:hypothetical protein
LDEFLGSDDHVLTVYESDAYVRDEFSDLESLMALLPDQPLILPLGGQ